MDVTGRALERQASAGDAQAAARAIAHRMRTGLSRYNVVAASILGDEASMMVLPTRNGAPEAKAKLMRFGVGKPAHAWKPLLVHINDHNTFCGRRVSPEGPRVDAGEGVPTCEQCTRSLPWRDLEVRAVVGLLTRLNTLNAMAAFRALLAIAECWLPYVDSLEPGTFNRKVAQLAHWAVRHGRVSTKPPPRLVMQLDDYDPAGIFDTSPRAWLYGLTEAAWSIYERGQLQAGDALNAAAVLNWATNNADNLQRLDEARQTIRERVVPYLLGDDDPLPFWAHQLETRP